MISQRYIWVRDASFMLPALLLLFGIYLGPVVWFLATSFVGAEGGFTLQNYLRIFESTTYVNIIGTTLKLAFVTTLVCVLIGYPVAYLIATSKAGKSLILLVLLPFWIMYLVRTFAWIVLLGRNGGINSILLSFGVIDRPLELSYSFTAVVIGMVHAMLPLAILTMCATMQNISPHLLRAAETLGARGSQAFVRIYLPLSLPGVAAAAFMVFIICLGFFVTPALLGSRHETVITQVIVEQLSISLDWGFASAISVLLLAITLVLVFGYQWLFGLAGVAGMTSVEGKQRGQAFRQSLSKTVAGFGQPLSAAGRRLEQALNFIGIRSRPGFLRRILVVFVCLVLIYLIVPVLFLIPVSFTKSTFLGWPPDFFTLRWYQAYLTNPIWTSAIVRSLMIATVTAIIATAVGTPAAFALVRGRFSFKSILMAILIIPMILPHMIPAIALFSLYSKIGLVGSMIGLVLAHLVFAIPLVVITVSAVLRNYDRRLDQAAAILGAKPMTTFRIVTFPLIRMGLVSAFLFSFITSFEELTVALFVTGGFTSTLPKVMWEDALNQVTPGLAAISSVILIILTLVIAINFIFQKKGGSTVVEIRG